MGLFAVCTIWVDIRYTTVRVKGPTLTRSKILLELKFLYPFCFFT